MSVWYVLLLGAAWAFLAAGPWVPPPYGMLLTTLGETLRVIADLIK